METSEQFAPSAATTESTSGTPAYPSKSTAKGPNGTATIVDLKGENSTKRSASATEYAGKRGISPATLDRLNVVSGTVFFPALERKQDAIIFNYFSGGERTYWKARSACDDKAFTSMKGGKASLYNLDNVLSGPLDIVYITEGEFDAAALVEAGINIKRVLSVPGGAPEREKADDDPLASYGYVKDALNAGLSKVKRIVWCGDSDGPGRALRATMARIFGAARFNFIEWPDGIKDANQFLMTDGAAALLELVMDGHLPWPVSGLFKLSEMPEPAPIMTWKPGFSEWESKVQLAPGMLSVVTGEPGHGKTVLWTQIWANIVRQYKISMCVASFETMPKPHMRRALRTLHSGSLEIAMTEQQIYLADKWIDEHYVWLKHPEQMPTLEWILDAAEVAVIRHGVRVLQIDPWNRLEHQRTGRETESEYIGRCLTAIYVFAQDMNCHVQILAHPAKREGTRRNLPPDLEDISGSSHWNNRVDQGFVVHRPKLIDGPIRCTEASLYHKKARFQELGYVCKLNLRYDLDRGKYVSTDYEVL